jgi:hypothetical protein
VAGTTGRPAAWRTVYHYFRTRTCDGTLSRLHNHLREQIRRTDGRATDPTAVIVDSQSVRGAEIVAKADRGYDAGKKVNGRRRHLVVDTTGPLLVTLVTTAGIRDRDAARLLLTGLHVLPDNPRSGVHRRHPPGDRAFNCAAERGLDASRRSARQAPHIIGGM